MKSNFRGILLLAVTVLSVSLARPVHAQTIGGAQESVIAGINAGQFKCNIYTTIFQLLNIAATSEGSRRLQALTMARDCACALSREINQVTHQPFQTLGPGIYDLAGYWHTVPAQTYGRALCDLLTALVLLFTPA